MNTIAVKHVLLLCVFLSFINECALHVAHDTKHRPNIVFILTDDQDLTMGGAIPMRKTQALISEQGATFSNAFVASPLCCPSRSAILTGSRAWQEGAEREAFPVYLKEQKYRTFFAGKYLNTYGFKSTGGVQHVPPGWDDWHGLVGNSVYYNYTLSSNGNAEKHGDTYKTDYLTDVINRKAEAFLEGAVKSDDPFFMMLSTPACHMPFTPAPQYEEHFVNHTAPRDGSFNIHGSDKHWLLRAAKTPMGEESMKYVDNTFRNRWRTLLSVDDMVENMITKLVKHDLLSNTYVVVTSDNGFHLGQFSLPNDKRNMYEFDIRVPFTMRGPGIPSNVIIKEPISLIDLAPTFVQLSGGEVSRMDGQSLVPLLHAAGTDHALDGKSWRSSLLVEHQGEYQASCAGCPQYDGQYMANCFPDCACNDARNNTYTCLRVVHASCDLVFCRFRDREQFVEVYDTRDDPDQLVNLAVTLSTRLGDMLQTALNELEMCDGDACADSGIDQWLPEVDRGLKKARMEIDEIRF